MESESHEQERCSDKLSSEIRPEYQLQLWQIILAMFPIAVVAVFISRKIESQDLDWKRFKKTEVDSYLEKKQTVLLNCRADWNPESRHNDKFLLQSLAFKKWVRSQNAVTVKVDWSNRVAPKVGGKLRYDWVGQTLVVIPNGELDQMVVLKGRVYERDFLKAVKSLE